MAEAKQGDTVKVHYTGTLDDGAVFDSSSEQEPLEFTIGQGQLIPDFEEAVAGMNVGDSTKITIPADKAYGPQREELVMVVEREQFPEGAELSTGQQFQLQQPDGQAFVVTVVTAEETQVTLDANHPLAGKDLTFDIQLIGIG